MSSTSTKFFSQVPQNKYSQNLLASFCLATPVVIGMNLNIFRPAWAFNIHPLEHGGGGDTTLKQKYNTIHGSYKWQTQDALYWV